MNVTANSDVSQVLGTRIVLPLTSPSSSPDPATMPSHHENVVSGTVKASDGRPVPNATVALLQRLDTPEAG